MRQPTPQTPPLRPSGDAERLMMRWALMGALGLFAFGLLARAGVAVADSPWEPFFPLREGKTWCYRYLRGAQGTPVRIRMSTSGLTKVLGYEVPLWLVREDWPDEMHVEGYRWHARRLERILGLQLETASGTTKAISPESLPLLSGSPSAGESWNETLQIYHQPHRLRGTVRGEEEVVVPAGRFRALRVESSLQALGTDVEESRFTDWYAREVGLVQSVAFVRGAQAERFELVACEEPLGSVAKGQQP